jgi:hypothetical protein
LDGKDDAEVLYPDHCNDGDGGAAWFGEFPSEADAAFIAQSREALPYWLGEVKRLRRIISEATEKMLPLISERDLLIKTNAELQEEGKRLKEALNAINNLAVGWREIEVVDGPTGEYMDEIYKLSLLPEEGKG